MTRRALFAALLAAAACSGGGRAPAVRVGRPPSLPPPPPPVVIEVKDPNFELVVVESVPNADDENASFTKIFVDGREAGKTAVGPRAQEKRTRLKLPAGNQPVRLEHWFLPSVGEWTRLPDHRQPRERFVRVEDGSLVRLSLRYDPDGAPSMQLSREPSPR